MNLKLNIFLELFGMLSYMKYEKTYIQEKVRKNKVVSNSLVTNILIH